MKKLEVKSPGLRTCRSHFVKICMSDILDKNLSHKATVLWILLCHLWDLAAKGNGWVTITRETAARLNIKKDAVRRALAELEAANMIEIRRKPRRAPRVRMVTTPVTGEISECPRRIW